MYIVYAKNQCETNRYSKRHLILADIIGLVQFQKMCK